MNNLKRKKIENIITNLLAKASITKPPVDVEKIVKTIFNLEVRKNTYDGEDKEFSGVLIRGLKKNVIGVNTKHHEHRQRFTIAHELGHFLFHEGDQVFIDKEYKVNFRDAIAGKGTDIKEIEANNFASMLLIPQEFLLKDLSESKIDIFNPKDIETLATTFANKYNVSPVSMQLRLSRIISVL